MPIEHAKPSEPAQFRDLGVLLTSVDASDGVHVFTPPPPEEQPVISAAVAVVLARKTSHAPRQPAIPTVQLVSRSVRRARRVDPDPGRLAYLVRWDGVSWMPSGPAPGPGERRAVRGPVTGALTVVIDAVTSEVLSTSLTGTRRRRSGDLHDAPVRARGVEAQVAPLWVRRPRLSEAFVAKAEAALQQFRNEACLTSSTTPGIEVLRPRIQALGVKLVRMLRDLADSTGSVLGADEIDEIVTACRRSADLASRVAGSPPTSLAEVLDAAIRSAFEQSL